MKRISLFLVLASLVVSFGLANAVSISLESVQGQWTAGKINPGVPITFTMRYTNDASYDFGGITNGYEVYTTDASPFTAVTADTLPWPGVDGGGWKTHFDLIFKIGYFSANGAGFDTAYIGGSKGATGNGIPAGFDHPAVKVMTGNITAGSTLCIDSC